MIGVEKLFGERGFTAMEQRSARPTFEITGDERYQGEAARRSAGMARAKITCRLVPNQKTRRTFAKSFATTWRKSVPHRCGWNSKPATARRRIWSRPKVAGAGALRACIRRSREPVLLRERLNPDCQRFQESLGAYTLLLASACRRTTPIRTTRNLIWTALKRPAHERISVRN